MRVLVAEGLTLEPQTTAHADDMFAVLADPALYAFENAPPPSVDWLRARFAMLESRRSPDGSERWLNWVIRLPDSSLAGYVQATLFGNREAYVAYALASTHWGRGVARRAVAAMLREIIEVDGVRTVWAIFKERNVRSRRLLECLSFASAPAEARARHAVESDEVLMLRRIGDA
jgi:RimJ/RimL family protein N-acetyltransferase